MPVVQKVSKCEESWNTFVYDASDEVVHPILFAIQEGDVVAFETAQNELAPVMIHSDTGTKSYELAFAGQLYMQGSDSVYGHGVCQNIAWKGAALGHSELLAYMLDNKTSLGLDNHDFIAAVGEANRRDASVALKEVFEQHPAVIAAYNKEMQPRQYQPAPSEPQLAETSELHLII